MLLSHCDCMVRKLAAVSCHPCDRNALQGQKGTFLHRHFVSLCFVTKEKCLSAHGVIRPMCDRRGEQGAGSTAAGLPTEVSTAVEPWGQPGWTFLWAKIYGMRTGWNFVQSQKGQTHHQQCLISPNTRPAAPALQGIPQKPYYRHRELKRQVIQSDTKGATVFGEQTRQYIWRMGSVLNSASRLHGVVMEKERFSYYKTEKSCNKMSFIQFREAKERK